MNRKEAMAIVRNSGYEIIERLSEYPDSRVIIKCKHDGRIYYGVGKAGYKLSDADSGDPRLCWNRDFGLLVARGRAEADCARHIMARENAYFLSNFAEDICQWRDYVGDAICKALSSVDWSAIST